MQWSFWQIGSFFASWVIGYGIVQSVTPVILRNKTGSMPENKSVFYWAMTLALVTVGLAAALATPLSTGPLLISGLIIFGVVFAINSSLHSYLIVHYAKADGVSLDVGFYYMANAMGRLIGTLLSGWIYQTAGLTACLFATAAFIFLAAAISLALPESSA